jgi:hypothetical protein
MRARGPAERNQVPCPACGAWDVEVTRPEWAQGLREWLGSGGPWRPTRQLCRRCGAASSAGSVGTLVVYRRGWRSVPLVPIHLFGILRRRRTMIPVPATYVTAAVVGAALGIAAQLTLGWPWWLVATGVVAAVWLLFFSTAFWGGGGSSRSLATEVLRLVSPARAMARDQREEVERFLAAPFPLYGLPASWPGPRQLGGWAGGGSEGQLVTTALELGHGDPLAEEGPQLRVEVSVERLDTGQSAGRVVAAPARLGRGAVVDGRAPGPRPGRALVPDRRCRQPARAGLVAGADPGGRPAGGLPVAGGGPPLGRPGRAGRPHPDPARP